MSEWRLDYSRMSMNERTLDRSAISRIGAVVLHVLVFDRKDGYINNEYNDDDSPWGQYENN
jgi:hypothetical protein